ncbi:MAG: DUF805 domain-containing protein [Mesorhizobium sp.]|nr:DUF805 domain-containing protein [bacterium M00.F.Ca.ET.205.01.1.1]TGU54431.1 DUF805 domain-containing protein [bacterium M00.F.Ca.ET.152.01.1.1]TGV38781.1 DUF805 domain-containing protein [Mesorhizobium sp. M00.F.Ca.ET.186.01.1.1]TGZ44004.1 DUF805 domain-containing protein [bacterium M00.F.Ca.ET.162.01.1.1]TJW33858.1 MAG: DUF805 domain-containing protein [Mesorhizobium sp.]
MAEKTDFFWFFLKTSGRVSRAAYFLGQLLLAIIQLFPLYHFNLLPEGSPESEVWLSIFVLVLLATVWPTIVLNVKRLHDLGRPGVFMLVLFVPLVQLVAILLLYLYPGQPGPNRYGRQTNSPATS